MCGIVGFTGTIDAREFLLNGLMRLEYRGYDSAGIALTHGGGLQVLRVKDKVAQLRKAVAASDIEGSCGIGHTRWATHGVPSEVNAHPHCDCSGTIAVVHNGIIENHEQLRETLQAQGHRFVSQTDTEVVAHLVEENYAALCGQHPKLQARLAGACATGQAEQQAALAAPAHAAETTLFVEAVRATVAQLSGSFALGILHADHPGTIVVSRNDSPMVIGSCEQGAVVASDIPALIEYTREVVYLDDRDLAVLHADGSIEYFDPAGVLFTPTTYHVDWSIEDAERGGYPDFMLKEIHEQPRVIRDSIAQRFDAASGKLLFNELPLSAEQLAAVDRVYIVACGTSYHAGLVGKELIEAWSRIPVQVEVASEFRYRNPIVTSDTLVLAITQSGETADTLEAVKQARTAGAHVVALTNVVGSRVTREAQTTLYIKARPEIAVAATKSFLAQVALLTLLGLYLAQERALLSAAQVGEIYAEMQQLPAQIEQILAHAAVIEDAAAQCAQADTALFIGRGVGATTCYEGALKLKEISYLHAEAFAAGEIKHGPIALIDPAGSQDPLLQTPVVAVALQSATYDKMLANIEEVLARGARVVALATEGDTRIAKLTDLVLYIPPVRECLSPITASVPLQLFARAIAIARGCDVDQPRNLAKSVTVE
ncbi:MAG: glutamine--fructose-6-phosphate transaminase (isomerizing) [Coriobacteriales bacterium]|jgi:glucosamine--fructose-6-phosphate aminotransferase (isomerizing)|nr:glutamine--fructose-6-phosphate transaminase (isomerizing) [Coriobacteriales bacterium]